MTLVFAVVITEGLDCARDCDDSTLLPFLGTMDIRGGGIISALGRTGEGLTGDLPK